MKEALRVTSARKGMVPQEDFLEGVGFGPNFPFTTIATRLTCPQGEKRLC